MFANLFKTVFGRRDAQAAAPSPEEAPEGPLETARRHRDAGDGEAAARAYRHLLAEQPEDLEALHFLADATYEAKQHEAALEHARLLARLIPEDPQYLIRCAHCEHALGNSAAARSLCEQALAMRPNLSNVHQLLSQIDLPGPVYSEVLRRLHATLRPRTYVEVGIFQGRTLALAGPDTRAIGVDPAPQVQVPLSALTQVHAETSDDFFASHDVRAEFGGLPVDLAFIDGMHRFEFALRDFMNLEALCTPESVILVHDCYPLDEATATRDQLTIFWSGDVWRLMLLLRRHRPDLQVHTIATPPTGLGIITGLDPKSTYIAEHLEEMTAQGLAMQYAELDRDKAGQLGRLANDWEKIAALLPASAAR